MAAKSGQPAVLPGVAAEVETVRFADPRWAPVRVFKGASHAGAPASAAPPAVAPRPQFHATAVNTELVTFGDGRGARVAVVRGSGPPNDASPVPVLPPASRVETVRFADGRAPLVTIVRGGGSRDDGIALFGSAAGGELDRVAFAVDGAESGHGANSAMWRSEFGGPQGPMQVSAAAALDVGGGDRFDLRQNRLIGRAYLAAMYRRYGNWPDAIAAYNWGPGNLDQWIVAGRPVDRLPLETARYLLRVLKDALLAAP